MSEKPASLPLNWRIGVYGLTLALVAITYCFSVFLPGLRTVIRNFEETGSFKSAAIINLLGAVFLTVVLLLMDFYTHTISVTRLVILFVACCITGFIVLTLHSAYKAETSGTGNN